MDKLPVQDAALGVQFEVKLWRAVLDQALEDVFSQAKGQSEKKREQERQEAIEWFEEEPEDFLAVCEMAMLKPHIIKQVYLHYKKEQ